MTNTKEVNEFPPWNFSWVIPGQLAAMGCPLKRENLQFIVSLGIKHLITLSPEMKPPNIKEYSKIQWTELPIEEFEAPSLQCIKSFIEICQMCESKKEALGVHCRQGLGRTGTMLACYLMVSRDISPHRAVTNVRILRPGSIETWQQENVVKNYHDYVRGLTALE